VRSEGLHVEKERATGLGFAVAAYCSHKKGKPPNQAASAAVFREVTHHRYSLMDTVSKIEVPSICMTLPGLEIGIRQHP
jgi:hypothetical protein